MPNALQKILFTFLALTLLLPAFAFAGELVIYSARKEHLIQPLVDAYTAETGIKISFVTDKAGPLLQRLKRIKYMLLMQELILLNLVMF